MAWSSSERGDRMSSLFRPISELSLNITNDFTWLKMKIAWNTLALCFLLFPFSINAFIALHHSHHSRCLLYLVTFVFLIWYFGLIICWKEPRALHRLARPAPRPRNGIAAETSNFLCTFQHNSKGPSCFLKHFTLFNFSSENGGQISITFSGRPY